MKVKFFILILLLIGFNNQSFAGYPGSSSKSGSPTSSSKHNFKFNLNGKEFSPVIDKDNVFEIDTNIGDLIEMTK